LTRHFYFPLKPPKKIKNLQNKKNLTKMAIFHFPQYEHELFCWYFKRLNSFLAQCEYYVGKWKILGILDEGVNSEI